MIHYMPESSYVCSTEGSGLDRGLVRLPSDCAAGLGAASAAGDPGDSSLTGLQDSGVLFRMNRKPVMNEMLPLN